MAAKTVKLKITSAVVIGGEVERAGSEVSVPEKLAKNLLQRSKAVLATAPDDAGEDEEKGKKPAKGAAKAAD